MIGETISLDEIQRLLEQLAARDQRTTGDADIIAWYQDLNAAYITYRDAHAAANHYYAAIWPRQKPQERHRLTAPLIIELVGKMRDERIANFVYHPSGPNETGAEYIENYNRQLQAVASGERPPAPSIAEALKPRPVAELVASVAAARVLPPEIAEVLERRRPPGTEVTCPACGAPPRQRCRTVTRNGYRTLSNLHDSRIKAAGGAS